MTKQYKSAYYYQQAATANKTLLVVDTPLRTKTVFSTKYAGKLLTPQRIPLISQFQRTWITM